MPKKRAVKEIDSWAEARERALISIETMTDDEDAELTAAALSDPDNPPRDEEWFREAKPMPDERLARYRGMRGPQRTPTKRPTSIRLDTDVVEHFRAGGPGWQSRINEALRKIAGLA
jgi:uncharacterized protein (DUF4415 family)